MPNGASHRSGHNQRSNKTDQKLGSWLKSESLVTVTLTIVDVHASLSVVDHLGRKLLPKITLSPANFAFALIGPPSLISLTTAAGNVVAFRFDSGESALRFVQYLKAVHQGIWCALIRNKNADSDEAEQIKHLEGALGLLTSEEAESVGVQLFGKAEFLRCMNEVSSLCNTPTN